MQQKLFSTFAACCLLVIVLAACSMGNPQGGPAPNSPTPDTPQAITMPSLALGSHPAIVYFDTTYSSLTVFNGTLSRYDTVTQRSAVISNLPDVRIEEAQVSRDGQWVLFIAYITDHDELRLVRIDGRYMQTILVAASYAALSNARWSPNQQYIAYNEEPPQFGPISTYLLDLKQRHLQAEVVQGNQAGALYFAPRKWLDNQHLALAGYADPYKPPESIFILDTSKGPNQHENDLQQVANNLSACGDFDFSSDGTQLFISTCTLSHYPQGSSTVTVQLLNGSASKAIFRSSTFAARQIRFLQPGILLLVGGNVLWEIHSDGSGQALLLTSSDSYSSQSFTSFSLDAWSNVSRDSSLIALQSIDQGTDTHSSALAYAALRNGALHSIASTFSGIGESNSDVSLAGWTNF